MLKNLETLPTRIDPHGSESMAFQPLEDLPLVDWDRLNKDQRIDFLTQYRDQLQDAYGEFKEDSRRLRVRPNPAHLTLASQGLDDASSEVQEVSFEVMRIYFSFISAHASIRSADPMIMTTTDRAAFYRFLQAASDPHPEGAKTAANALAVTYYRKMPPGDQTEVFNALDRLSLHHPDAGVFHSLLNQSHTQELGIQVRPDGFGAQISRVSGFIDNRVLDYVIEHLAWVDPGNAREIILGLDHLVEYGSLFRIEEQQLEKILGAMAGAVFHEDSGVARTAADRWISRSCTLRETFSSKELSNKYQFSQYDRMFGHDDGGHFGMSLFKCIQSVPKSDLSHLHKIRAAEFASRVSELGGFYGLQLIDSDQFISDMETVEDIGVQKALYDMLTEICNSDIKSPYSRKILEMHMKNPDVHRLAVIDRDLHWKLARGLREEAWGQEMLEKKETAAQANQILLAFESAEFHQRLEESDSGRSSPPEEASALQAVENGEERLDQVLPLLTKEDGQCDPISLIHLFATLEPGNPKIVKALRALEEKGGLSEDGTRLLDLALVANGEPWTQRRLAASIEYFGEYVGSAEIKNETSGLIFYVVNRLVELDQEISTEVLNRLEDKVDFTKFHVTAPVLSGPQDTGFHAREVIASLVKNAVEIPEWIIPKLEDLVSGVPSAIEMLSHGRSVLVRREAAKWLTNWNQHFSFGSPEQLMEAVDAAVANLETEDEDTRGYVWSMLEVIIHRTQTGEGNKITDRVTSLDAKQIKSVEERLDRHNLQFQIGLPKNVSYS